MRTTLRVVFSFAFLSIIFSAGYAQQPRRVLFETFTNSYDLCPEANGLDAAFKATLASANGSKIIHLNNHIANVGDPMVVAGSTANLESLRLSNNTFPYPIFNGAVDHTVFTSTGVRLTSKYEPSGSTEWNTRINERVGDEALVAITLTDAKMDKIGQADYWRLVAKVKVTLQDANSDSLRIFYAITQDNVFYEQCQNTKPVTIKNHNNVVRFIDVHGIALDLKGKPQGASTEVTITHDISKLESHKYKLEDMKFIAFVERGASDNYEVVQAWELRKNLDTLAPPAAAITISNAIEGKSYAPGDNVFITFDKTNIDSVKLEFSSNNGSSWEHIININTNRYFWTAPDITTTQGQIRVSDLTNSALSSTSGNFTIKLPLRGIRILKPQGGDTAFLTKKLVIEWEKIGSEIIEKVDLDYSVNGGTTYAILAKNQTGTTFTWNLFGPIPITEQAMIRITEVTDSAEKVTVSSDPFYIMNPITGGGRVESSKIIRGVRLYPQPLESGSMLTIEFALDKQDRIDFMLFDMLGKQIYSLPSYEAMAGLQSHTLQLPPVAAGAYILSMRDADGGAINKRIEIR